MIPLQPALRTHIACDATRLAVCWRIQKTDGTVIRATEHDRDLVIASGSPTNFLDGTYQATTGIRGSNVKSAGDLSVDNMEVMGQLHTSDITAVEIEAGLYDGAQCTVFLCPWDSPSTGQRILRHGTLGNITRTQEGEYRAELRGLAQALQQRIVRAYGSMCDADLGDTRCGITLAALRVTGSVSSLTSTRVFVGVLSPGSPTPAVGYFVGGLLRFTSGANNGIAREVKTDGSPLGNFAMVEAFPYTIAPGDTFTVDPGCDKSAATCGAKFGNIVNFRGFPFIPGMLTLLKGAQ